MAIDIYFETLNFSINFEENQLGNLTEFNTEDNFPEWEKADIAIIGIEESRNGATGTELAPNQVRDKLYRLYSHSKEIKICDLGNIKKGATVEDTYFAIADSIKELRKKDVFVILIGGSQDLTYANYLAYEKLEQTINLVTIDNKLDFGEDENEISTERYLQKIVLHTPSFLFNYANIGHQTYLTNPKDIKLMNDLYFDHFRLGEIQSNIQNAEPAIRNADIISVDLNSIRNGSFSSGSKPEPNGFYGEEICQLMRYAGMSDKLSSIGLWNYKPEKNQTGTDSQLIAQMIWFIVDGYYNRKKDYPIGTKEDYTRYRVHVEGTEHEIIFYKSNRSDRWWIDVPYPPDRMFKFERHHLVPCTYETYQKTSEGNLPDLWWKTYRKLN